jgi:hypothetical protein
MLILNWLNIILFLLIHHSCSTFAQASEKTGTIKLTQHNEDRLILPDTYKLKKIDKIYFLIHSFCYADMACNKNESDMDEMFSRYLAHENKCALTWCSQLHELKDNEALVIIPWNNNKTGPVSDYNSSATSLLGDRCFILDCAGPLDQAFWADTADSFNEAVLNEFKSAFILQKDHWNKEELYTSLHAVACCRQLDSMMKKRRYYYDKRTVTAESWGASFDGCVTKYTCSLQRILELTNVIYINFKMTVPDAAFLLGDVTSECIILKNGLRLFIFKNDEQTFALYTTIAHSMENQVSYVGLKINPKQVTVKSKQGIRLWPDSEEYCLQSAPAGYFEPPQELIKYKNDRLYMPVSSGFVYRLAKAPAYIFANPEMTYNEFKDILTKAEIEAQTK